MLCICLRFGGHMKSIYVVFAKTDLRVGRLIRLITHNRYNHVAISLDGLKTLCSFSRIYLNHPLVGGYVEESPNRYLLSNRCFVKAVEIDVSDNTYALLAAYIAKMQRNPEAYVYNYGSAASYVLGRRLESERAFTCVEFVRDVLVRSGVLADIRRSCVRISELERELSAYDCREGTAKEIFPRTGWGSDIYLAEVGRIAAAKEAMRRFGRMIRSY